MQPDPSIRKVLIYRIGSLGDTVVALPSFHLLARAFPNAERRLLTNYPVHAKAPASAAVLGDSGLVHGYMRYTIGTRNPVELLRLAWQIRSFNPDLLAYLMPVRTGKAVRRDEMFFRFSGVRRIAGLPAGDTGSNRFDQATDLWESEAARLLRCLDPSGATDVSDLSNWDLKLTDAEKNKACELLAPFGFRPIIACGPGTKMQAKDWGSERWKELLERLNIEHPRHALVLIGAREDSDLSEFAADKWTGPRLNLCGQITPRETAAILEHAAVFLGPDSGPMHLAACAGVPCVIAFSARGRRGIWFPAGSNHQVIYHRTSCQGCNLETCAAEARRCLTSIAVQEMVEAVGRVLSRQAE
ncbi:MAG: glycosyltransferase family 9 protein [Terracidiphilus sp.]